MAGGYDVGFTLLARSYRLMQVSGAIVMSSCCPCARILCYNRTYPKKCVLVLLFQCDAPFKQWQIGSFGKTSFRFGSRACIRQDFLVFSFAPTAPSRAPKPRALKAIKQRQTQPENSYPGFVGQEPRRLARSSLSEHPFACDAVLRKACNLGCR